MNTFNYRKAVQALAYFAEESGGKLNKMKALKLIWLADRLHLRRYARTVTGDQYFALKFGPVATSVKDILYENGLMIGPDEQAYSGKFLDCEQKYEYSLRQGEVTVSEVFSQTDRECIKEVFNTYGNMDEFELSELSHKYPEWKKFESDLYNMDSKKRFKMNFTDFFEEAEDEGGLFADNRNSLEVTKELFMEQYSSKV